MQIKIFTVPVISGDITLEELNKFLRSEKIITVEKESIVLKDNAYWSFCVSYLPRSKDQVAQSISERREKIDYKQVLDETTFNIFSRLRMIRKRLADDDAVPAYAVFTDAELSEIAKLESINPQSLKTISGIGAKKIEKYGNNLCKIYIDETDGQSS